VWCEKGAIDKLIESSEKVIRFMWALTGEEDKELARQIGAKECKYVEVRQL
jgi:hypothetical protein